MKKILLVTAACLLLAWCTDGSNENKQSDEQGPTNPVTKVCISCNGQGSFSYKDSYGNTQYIKCPTCNGTGIMPVTGTCISCYGQGSISYKDSYGNTQYIKCPTCNGTGIMPY